MFKLSREKSRGAKSTERKENGRVDTEEHFDKVRKTKPDRGIMESARQVIRSIFIPFLFTVTSVSVTGCTNLPEQSTSGKSVTGEVPLEKIVETPESKTIPESKTTPENFSTVGPNTLSPEQRQKAFVEADKENSSVSEIPVGQKILISREEFNKLVEARVAIIMEEYFKTVVFDLNATTDQIPQKQISKTNTATLKAYQQATEEIEATHEADDQPGPREKTNTGC